MIEEFFQEIDQRWKEKGEEPIVLPIIGSTALFLQASYNRGTKDSDILEIGNITPVIKKELKKIAGPGTKIAKRHKMYVDMVGFGLPFLPQNPLFHPLTKLNKKLKSFKIEALDITDVVISKLKTFRAQDVSDIHEMTLLNLIPPEKLIERFQSAMENWLMDARAAELPEYVKNLHVIQRDFLHMDETTIVLPDWVHA